MSDNGSSFAGSSVEIFDFNQDVNQFADGFMPLFCNLISKTKLTKLVIDHCGIKDDGARIMAKFDGLLYCFWKRIKSL